MKQYLEIISIDIETSDQFLLNKYPKPGVYLNTRNNQLFMFDGTTLTMVGGFNLLSKLPIITELEDKKVSSELLADSLLKMAAIINDPGLARDLIKV
jgi:hypothetical protein